MNYGFGQTGRVVNALYGPFFSYILGFLLFITGSWFKFQVLTTYIVFLVGSYGMYQLNLKLKTPRVTATIITLLFLTTGYVSSWTSSNSFSTWGGILIPFVLIEAIDLINNDEEKFNWVDLGTVVAVVAQVHLLATVLCVLTLIPFFVYELYQSNQKNVMAYFVESNCVIHGPKSKYWGHICSSILN